MFAQSNRPRSMAASLGTPTFAENFQGNASGYEGSGEYDTYFTSNSGNIWYVTGGTSGTSISGYAGLGGTQNFGTAQIAFVPGGLFGTNCLQIACENTSTSNTTCGEVISNTAGSALMGYGAYEVCFRASCTSATPMGAASNVSGAVSSPFIINSANGTAPGPNYIEMDIPECETASGRNTWAEYTLYNASNQTGSASGEFSGSFVYNSSDGVYYLKNSPSSGFNYYGIIWTSTFVKFYLNGAYQGEVTSSTYVPILTSPQSTYGVVWDLNHYGNNSSGWGGTATVGTPRYAYFQSVNYWAGVTAL